MHGSPHTPSNHRPALQTQACGLLTRHRTLAGIGTDIAVAARVAAAIHMAESAPTAQNPRDQAARLRDLVASMKGGPA